MQTKVRYSLKEMIHWTRWEIYGFLLFSSIVVFLFEVLHFSFFHVPWTPVALIGTAVAFIVGFRNNADYGRIWEARKIWGGIVNTSRTWEMSWSGLFTWLAVLFCTLVSWVFHTMERIGTVGENPFEGSANDVPISTISRGIEIDLRQLFDEDINQIPKQFPEEHNIQM